MKFFTILSILPLVFFASCGTGQKLQQNAPATIEDAHFQKWISGAKGMGSGINIAIVFKNTPKDITLKDVYFRSMKTELVTKLKELNTFRGYLKTKYNTQEDLVMDADPKKEYGNKPPKIKEEFPFELKDNEAVISYVKNGKTLFYKTTLKERDVKSYPKIPQ